MVLIFIWIYFLFRYVQSNCPRPRPDRLLQHHCEPPSWWYCYCNSAVDVQNLNDVQRAADSFFRSQVPNLNGAALVSGETNGDRFTYQYLNQNAPVTITQVAGDRVDEDSNTFRLVQTYQSLSGPVEGGRLTKVTDVFGIESFEKALENLDWDWSRHILYLRPMHHL